MLKKSLILLFFVGSVGKFFSQNYNVKQPVIPHTSPALRFTENLGQWDNNILFRAQLDGGVLFIEKNGLAFNFYNKQKYRSLHQGGIYKGEHKNTDINGHAYKVLFNGCNNIEAIEKYQKGSDYENFFIGNDKRKWKGNVQNYHQIILKNLYNNIDYEAITSVQGLKYNFHIKPSGEPSNIKLEYKGVNKLKLKDGTLTFKLEVNEVIEQKPYAYQLINNEVKIVACEYVLKNNFLGFEFPNGYNKSYTLIIDPVLVFAAQSGSTADNFGMTATYDKQGNLFAGGTVFDVGYPFVTGSYSNAFNGPAAYGNTDVVITKYNPTGNALIYSTYLGGSGSEIVTSLITDSLDNLYLYGATGSANFPTQGGLGSPFHGGDTLRFEFNGTYFDHGTDIYVGKFNPTGSSLLASTYVGGTKNDGVNHNNVRSNFNVPMCFYNTVPSTYFYFPITQEYKADSLQYNYGDQYRGEIQLDKNLNVYIASSTRSSDFPTVNPISSTLNGKQDAVVFKLNSNLSTLIYSTYLGGNGNDAGYSLIVDDTLQVYVTGGTYSTNFPTKPGCYQTNYNGGKADGFISKISTSGSTLLKSTYIGTPSYDQSYFIQKDAQGRIYVYGQSQGNMPVTAGTYSNAGSHQFISRLDNQLTNLNRSTVFGSGTSTIDISPSAFAVDICNGNVYLSGWGGSFINCVAINNMPITPGALYSTPPNGIDFYLMALGPNMNTLLYGSYFGGNQSAEHVDGGTSRFDNKGIIYQSVCAGCASYTSLPGPSYTAAPGQDFPVTPGAWPAALTVSPGLVNKSDNCNNGVFKLDFKLQNTIASLNSSTITGCPPLTVNFTNGTPGTGYVWYLGPGNTTSTTSNPVVTFSNTGTYTISLVVYDTTRCVKKDSAIKIITVNPKPVPAFTYSLAQCANTFSTTNNSTGSGNTYSWNFGDASPTTTLSSPTHTYAGAGTFSVTLVATNSFGCKDSVRQPVSVFVFNPGIAGLDTICRGYTASITASGGTSYSWSPAATLSNSSVASPVATPSASTIYTVIINNNSPGYTCSKTLTTSVIVYPKPVANFNYTVNPCGGGVTFNDLSTPDVVMWNWNLSSTPSVTSAVQNPYHFYAAGGTNTIVLITTNNFGCIDTSQQILSIAPPPPVSVSGASIICKGGEINLNATGGVSYTWTPSASLIFPFTSDPIASPTVSTQYSVVISTSLVVGGNQCQFLLTTNVNVTQLSAIPISATANPVIVTTGSATTLTYIGDPGALVTWFPLGSTTPATGYTVIAHPDRPTTYTAVATNGACRENVEVSVEAYSAGCLDNDVFVPNTFTPNSDGKNDVLFVRGIKVDEVYFAVYNRWGEKVFDTTDKTKGWDGVYKNRQADVGVFGWYLKVKCINGEESFKKGNVTLIR